MIFFYKNELKKIIKNITIYQFIYIIKNISIYIFQKTLYYILIFINIFLM